MKLKKQCIMLISIFIMIIISNIFVSATQVITNYTYKTRILGSDDNLDLPAWSIGDFWEYNMPIEIAGIVIFDVTRMDVLVTHDDNNEYTLEMFGYLDKLIFNSFDWSSIIKAAYIEGIAHIDKSTLSIKDYTLTLTANINLPVKYEIRINFNMEFNHTLNLFNFPISLGNQYNLNSTVNVYITGYIKKSKETVFNIDEQSLNNPINDNLLVTTKEILATKAGSFESFLISGGLGNPSDLWYSPETGFLVKVDQFIPKFIKISNIEIAFGCYLELLSTNFNYPKNNAPATPNLNGPTNGNIMEEYKCTVKTIDPNGNPVYYKIDWGDGSVTDWIGPYNSGEEITINHKFYNQADYKIRVKAKDVNNYQTSWTRPLTVTIPRSNILNLNFLILFKNHLNLFPILNKLLHRLEQ